jgi:hypothetical protein
MMDMVVNWYAEITVEEMQALVDYHREQQYAAARKEEYSEAEYYKDRAHEWESRIGKKLKVVEESK